MVGGAVKGVGDGEGGIIGKLNESIYLENVV